MTRAPSRSRRSVRPQARRVRHARLVLACLLAAAGGLAQAGDCRVSATSINFGSYDPVTGTGPVDSTGGVRVDCRATYSHRISFQRAVAGVLRLLFDADRVHVVGD